MYKRQIQNAWRTGKRLIGGAASWATKIAASLDHGISISKRLYGALSPAIQDFAPAGTTRNIMDAFGAYDSGRNEVMEGYNNVRTQLNLVQRAVPEISFT